MSPMSRSIFLCDAPSHGAEHFIGSVLQRHIEVVAHVGFARHHIEYVHRESRRERIVQANPIDAFDVTQPIDQFREFALFVKVEAVV